MDLARFRASLTGPAPPPGVAGALAALWWDARGDWDRAHAAAQADDSRWGSAVHAYLHRKEPDPDNARYWYARAGRPPATGPLEAEWAALAAGIVAADTSATPTNNGEAP
ncbi:MAG: hypothetical protein KGL52_05500 [Rhodospirillales bacterium]|jgi:hypothetical protein|nr:hypothetical protein [Rhodospirillales bacterium]